MRRLDGRQRRGALLAAVALGAVLTACGSDGEDADDATATVEAPASTASEPAATDPPDTEPGDTEPVDTEPEPTEPAPTAPEPTEPTDTESVGIAGDGEITEFDFGGGDFYFDTRGVTELPAGTVRATMTIDDVATESHVAMFARVKEGNTVDQVLEAAAADFTGLTAEKLVDFYGGVNAIDAGESATSIVNLVPGTYILACFIPSQDGTLEPHSARGMWSEIEVVEPQLEYADIETDGTISMTEMAFELPEGFDGNGTYAVANDGEILHEMGVVRLEEGVTGQDVQDFYDFSTGPPVPGNEPDDPIGGFAANHPGNTGYVELDLDPGNYALICFVGSPPPDFTHLNQGMWIEFSVPPDG